MSSETEEWEVLSSKLARQVLAQLLKFEYGDSEVDLGGVSTPEIARNTLDNSKPFQEVEVICQVLG